MNRGRLSKLISVVITGILVMNGLPSMVLADVINTPTIYSVQSDLNYEITTNITSSWINHESIDLVLTNTGSETIHNWYLTFYTPYNIDNIWNGSLYETDGNGTYTITSNGWNQDIHPGETVTIGATFSSTEEEVLTIDPEWYLLNTEATVVDSSLYTLNYTEYSSWESGFTGRLTLQPHVDCQHWSLTFDSNRDLTAVSSAVLKTEDDGYYEITHDENNMRLFANNAYNFGIQGVNSEDPLEFTDVELTVVDLAYHLTIDEDGNGIPDYLDFIGGGSIVGPTPTPTDAPTVSPTETPTEEPTETPSATPTAEPSITEEPTEAPTNEPTETITPTEEPTPTPIIDYESDQDLDSLPDYIEDQLGTDPLKADTDDDGLSDYIEVMIGYDPTNPDTNGNGIADGNEDYDNDGLSNLQELSLETNMVMEDTDYDYLNDGDEINIYGTDPLVPDFDGDGVLDGDEVAIGKNPTDNTDGVTRIVQTLTRDINNADDPAITSVTVTTSLVERIDRVLNIEDYYNIDVYSTDVYGRVGSPISLECDEDINTATLSIHYDESCLGESLEEGLGVLWFDEVNGIYVVQEQAVIDTQNNTITLELNHFSTYVVVDLDQWNNPVLPDYSGCLYFQGHRFDPGIACTYPNKLPSYYEEQEWAAYVESMNNPNLIRLTTFDQSWTYSNVFGYLGGYWYHWLVMDTTDIDEDGVPDFMETRGVMGSNNHIYYSEVGLDDSDYDELPDEQEYGVTFIISESFYDVVKVFVKSDSGNVVPYTDFCMFEDYFDIIDHEHPVVYSCGTNPSDPDTDGDYYRDDIDSNPRTSALRTIGLNGVRYGIGDKGAEGYIHINNAPSYPSTGYGGNQSWFINESINGTNLHILDSGCGLIATNDILLYLNNGVQDYEWADYRNEVLSTYLDFYNSQSWQTDVVPNSFAFSPLFIQECFLYNGHSGRECVVDRNIWGGVASSINSSYIYDSLLDDIEDSLRDDRPVILMEYDLYNYFRRKNGLSYQSLTMYQIDSGAREISDLFHHDSDMHMEYHYVTITGMVINRNLDRDDPERVYLRVQSWGEEYYINYNEFINYNCSLTPDSHSGRIIFID